MLLINFYISFLSKKIKLINCEINIEKKLLFKKLKLNNQLKVYFKKIDNIKRLIKNNNFNK